MGRPTASQERIVGSWLVNSKSDGNQSHYLFTLTADFCVNVSSCPVFPERTGDPHASSGPLFVSPEHGAWESRNGNRAALTVVRLGADGTGSDVGGRVTRAAIAFDGTSS
jgi:hypothetical protein